jgi:hypothetical protein
MIQADRKRLRGFEIINKRILVSETYKIQLNNGLGRTSGGIGVFMVIATRLARGHTREQWQEGAKEGGIIHKTNHDGSRITSTGHLTFPTGSAIVPTIHFGITEIFARFIPV